MATERGAIDACYPTFFRFLLISFRSFGKKSQTKKKKRDATTSRNDNFVNTALYVAGVGLASILRITRAALVPCLKSQ